MLDEEQIPITKQTREATEETPEASNSGNTTVPPTESDQDDDPWAEDYSAADYPEEETITENEEVAGAKYQVENEGSPGGTFAVTGDHAQQVNINYVVQLTHKARQEANESDERESNNSTEDDLRGDLYQLIGSALASVHRHEMILVKTPPGERKNDKQKSMNSKELPQWSDEELAYWYYDLTGYEQCYVQAVAVLHGARVSEVSRRADSLYILLKMDREQINISTQSVDKMPLYNTLQVPLPPSLHDGSSAELHKRTHTFTQRVNGVERLFWRDVDFYGQSIFGLRLLRFLAGELLNKGEHGKDFLDRLEQWSVEGQEECRLFAARALGIFLWCQDAVALRQRAYKWARIRSLPSWRRTAMLLDGAYDIDQLCQQEGEHVPPSLVLVLLKEWRERGQQLPEITNSQTDIYVKCAAANAYELIGKRFPEVALRELDQLLFSVSLETRNIDLLLAAITSAYISLSWSGHIFSVLTCLAQIAKQSLLQSGQTSTFRERILYRQQCEARLGVSLNAFFFIAATSFSFQRTIDLAAYEKPLPDPPIFPDPLGRDVVLAGLLERDTHSWFEQVAVLMAAAIMEKKRAYRSSAFDFISKWAQNFQGPGSVDEETTALSPLKCFLVKLDTIFETWLDELKKRGKAQVPVCDVYRKQLRQWAKKKGVIGVLSQEVLRQLNHSSQSE